MRLLGNISGYFIAGLCVGKFWNISTNLFGSYGGWLSALFITGSLWFINHYIGLINNKKDAVFVDMGFGVGIALTARSIFSNGIGAVADSIPTFACITIGAIGAGIVTGLIQRKKSSKATEKKKQNDIKV